MIAAIWLLLTGTALAQTCGSADGALGDLNAAVELFYEVAGGDWAGFCPDDLSEPLDVADADARAARMGAEDRAVAAELLLETLAAMGPEHTQAIANGAALLDALMGAMRDDRQDVSQILDALLALAGETDDPLLERQIALNLWRQGVDDPRVDALVARFLPTRPDYDQLFRGGRTTMKTVIHTGSDGFEHSDFHEVFERAGAEVTEVDGGPDLHVRYTVRPDDPTLPAITWEIDIVDGGFPPEDVFDLMGDDATDVGMFADHSQLGTSLDRSLRNAPQAPGAADFMWVDACKSKVFASRISQAFPEGHFIYTKDAEYFRDMSRAFQRGLVALSNRYDYDQMRRYVSRGDLYQGKNYYFPDDPEKLTFQDQDGDGISDAEDRVYDVEPPGAEPASRGVHIANTYLGYSGAFPGSEDEYRPDGVFDGEPDGPRTRLRVAKDTFGQERTFVAVSDELLEMDQSQRTALIARDIAMDYASERGWSADRAEAAAFLAGAAVYDVWNGYGWNDYVGETLPGVSLPKYRISEYLDDHDFVVRSKLDDFVDYVEEQRQ